MPPFDRVILAGGPGERRLALLRDDAVLELCIDRFAPAEGDILLGRVLVRPTGLDGAFIDIGDRLPGFVRRPGRVSEGAAVIVQVVAAARRDKGASLSLSPELAGRWLRYGGARRGVGLSRQITGADQRRALTALLTPLVTAGEAVLIRSAAASASPEALGPELDHLRQRWRQLQLQAKPATPPVRLIAPGVLARLLAEAAVPPRLEVDQAWLLPEARSLLPTATLAAGCWQHSGAADQLEAALARQVSLPGGGRLLIDETAAATLIDVDGGPLAPAAANQAALPEILRQIRLRGLAGQILIDLVSDPEPRALAALTLQLRAGVVGDPTPTQVLGPSRLGLIEISRARRRPSLAEQFLTSPITERSAESLALEALAAALAQALATPHQEPLLVAAPAVISFLEARPALLAETAQRLGRPLRWRTDPGMQGYLISARTP
jgi:Rne/Rng family ribonuclease